MPFRGIEKCKGSRGSITIEASVSMVVFAFAFISLLSVINICRLQAHMGNALNRAALDLSEYSYFYYVSGVYSAAASVKDSAAEAKKKIGDPADTADLIGYALSFFGQNEESFSDAGRTLLLAGVSDWAEAAESRFITAPIVKGIFTGYLVQPSDDPDAYLKSRGVIGGINGLDFSMSVLFPAEEPNEIQLVLCYEVGVPFLKGLKIPVLQNAVTGAWLGGDETKYIFQNPGSQDGEPSSDESGSVWSRTAFDRGTYFSEYYAKSHPGAKPAEDMQGVAGYDKSSSTYYNCVSINTFSESYNPEGFSAAAACDHTLRKVKNTISSVRESADIGTAAMIEYTVYIPEDTSDSVVLDLQKYLDEKAASMETSEPQIKIAFKIVKAGGSAGD